jgi:hypothetical protein
MMITCTTYITIHNRGPQTGLLRFMLFSECKANIPVKSIDQLRL